jgi:acyl carrier protein
VQERVQERVDAIIRVIVDRVNPDLDAAALSSDTRLIKAGLALDSMAMLELVTGLEDELGIMIDESELKLEVFDNIGCLARFLGEQSG